MKHYENKILVARRITDIRLTGTIRDLFNSEMRPAGMAL